MNQHQNRSASCRYLGLLLALAAMLLLAAAAAEAETVRLADDTAVKASQPCEELGPGWSEYAMDQAARGLTWCKHFTDVETTSVPHRSVLADVIIASGDNACPGGWAQYGYKSQSNLGWCKRTVPLSAAGSYRAVADLAAIYLAPGGRSVCAERLGAGWEGFGFDGHSQIEYCKRFATVTIEPVGTLAVRATLNGEERELTLTGIIRANCLPGGATTFTHPLPAALAGVPVRCSPLTLEYTAGGPADAALEAISYDPENVISPGGTLTVTYRFRSLPPACVAPTGLNPAGTIRTPDETTSITFSWNAVPGAVRYNVRLDDGTPDRHDDPRFATCAPSPHYYCENGITATSISDVPVKASRTYQFWVDPIFDPPRAYCNGSARFTVERDEPEVTQTTETTQSTQTTTQTTQTTPTTTQPQTSQPSQTTSTQTPTDGPSQTPAQTPSSQPAATAGSGAGASGGPSGNFAPSPAITLRRDLVPAAARVMLRREVILAQLPATGAGAGLIAAAFLIALLAASGLAAACLTGYRPPFLRRPVLSRHPPSAYTSRSRHRSARPRRPMAIAVW